MMKTGHELMSVIGKDHLLNVPGVVITPVGECGDLAAVNRLLTMHEAASLITVFGHRMSKTANTTKPNEH